MIEVEALFRCLEQSLSREEEELESAQEETTKPRSKPRKHEGRAKNLCKKLFICGHSANKSLSFLRSFFGQSQRLLVTLDTSFASVVLKERIRILEVSTSRL